MNFLNLSPLAIGIGLLAIAGALFLLQQLRIRYTELPVATTLFWAAAVREAPVRVLRQRFRHLLAYLLVLLICWLLWIGFGGPLFGDPRTAGFNILVIDGSAHAATADAFEQSKRQLLNDVGKYGRDSREVFLSGAQNVRILAAGEEKLVLERRLNEFEPVPGRSTIDELLRILPRNDNYPDQVNVVFYGRAPVSPEALERLPEGYSVSRRSEADADIANRGIVALGIGEAMSGDWDKVDVLFRILATEGLSIDVSNLVVRSGDRDVADDDIETLANNEFRVRDVIADGSTFEVRILEPDDMEFDNVAQVSLPAKERIQVTVGDGVPDSITRALESDAGLEIVGSDGVVAVLGSEDPESTVPYMRTVPLSAQDRAFVIGYTGDVDANEALHQSVANLGLSQIDAVSLATDFGHEIGVKLEVGDIQHVSIWEDLVGDQFNFKDSMSFPLFISKAIRYLANQDPWYAYLAAGRQPIEQTSGSSLASTDLLAEYAVGASYVRNEAGALELEDGNALQVSLLDPSAALPRGELGLTGSSLEITAAQSAWGLVTWLILLALVLLGLEWYLYQRGLMP